VRLVQNAAQLQAAILESLGRLQDELQGDLPAVTELWDTTAARPKDEEALSDRVARHLRTDLGDRGIVANREVVLSFGGSPGIAGERTDVYVNATAVSSHGVHDTVTVIVEVKGSWHAELLTAMKSQLCVYLASNHRCNHGIYLAGWFLCNRWAKDDPRKSRSARHGDMASLSTLLSDQAMGLSSAERTLRAFVLDVAWH